jgi:hypothetical protein
MDLKCGCCGGELSWAEWNVLENAPKNEVIIFTCNNCKCGYDTSASRTHTCEERGRNIFKFTAPSLHKEAGEGRIRNGDRKGHSILSSSPRGLMSDSRGQRKPTDIALATFSLISSSVGLSQACNVASHVFQFSNSLLVV